MLTSWKYNESVLLFFLILEHTKWPTAYWSGQFPKSVCYWPLPVTRDLSFKHFVHFCRNSRSLCWMLVAKTTTSYTHIWLWHSYFFFAFSKMKAENISSHLHGWLIVWRRYGIYKTKNSLNSSSDSIAPCSHSNILKVYINSFQQWDCYSWTWVFFFVCTICRWFQFIIIIFVLAEIHYCAVSHCICVCIRFQLF